jgi:hypothetical protein
LLHIAGLGIAFGLALRRSALLPGAGGAVAATGLVLAVSV